MTMTKKNSNSRKGIEDKTHIENLDIEKLQKLIDSKRDYRYSEFCPMIGLPKLQGNGVEMDS